MKLSYYLCHILSWACFYYTRFPPGIFTFLISNWASHKWSYYSQLHQQHLLFQRKLLKYTQCHMQIPCGLSHFTQLAFFSNCSSFLSWFSLIYTFPFNIGHKIMLVIKFCTGNNLNKVNFNRRICKLGIKLSILF